VKIAYGVSLFPGDKLGVIPFCSASPLENSPVPHHKGTASSLYSRSRESLKHHLRSDPGRIAHGDHHNGFGHFTLFFKQPITSNYPQTGEGDQGIIDSWKRDLTISK